MFMYVCVLMYTHAFTTCVKHMLFSIETDKGKLQCALQPPSLAHTNTSVASWFGVISSDNHVST